MPRPEYSVGTVKRYFRLGKRFANAQLFPSATTHSGSQPESALQAHGAGLFPPAHLI